MLHVSVTVEIVQRRGHLMMQEGDHVGGKEVRGKNEGKMHDVFTVKILLGYNKRKV